MDEPTLEMMPEPQLSFIDYPTKRGSCLTYFVAGCGFRCVDCQNCQLQVKGGDLWKKYGQTKVYFYPEDVVIIMDAYDKEKNRNQRKVTIMGGDPMFKDNRDFIGEVIRIAYVTHTNLRFCIYTGHEIDEVLDFFNTKYANFSEWASTIEFIKTGRYINTLVRPATEIGKHNGKFRLASTNQKLYWFNPKTAKHELISLDGESALV